MASRWYVVQARNGHEQKALTNLEDQHFKCFLPMYLEQKMSRGKPIAVMSPLFLSYLFVNFDITKDRWRAIQGTRGVYQLVTATNERVSPLPEGFVEELIAEHENKGSVGVSKAMQVVNKYSVGDKINVVEGVLSGLSGTCQAIKKDRVTVLIALLSGNRAIDLPSSSIRGA